MQVINSKIKGARVNKLSMRFTLIISYKLIFLVKNKYVLPNNLLSVGLKYEYIFYILNISLKES